jgi:poly(3-hydroxybutyrate) depolymerase
LAYDNCGPNEETRSCRWGTSCADDAGLFRALIEEVSEGWSIDPDRVYMTGFSQGGQTVQGLACELSDILAAVSPHHGFAANGYTCAPSTPLSLFQVWGLNDNVVNGHEQPSSDGMIYDGADETALEWAAAQGCSLTPTPYATVSDGLNGWSCAEHAGCSTGAEVVTCSWDGDHVWGRNNTNGNFALEATWAFFEAQSR